MPKYRIIRSKHLDCSYVAQRRVLFVFWKDLNFPSSLDYCEWLITDRINMDKIKKANPTSIIVKEYNV